MSDLDIYTDGSGTTGNPGGWAFVAVREDGTLWHEEWGAWQLATNNQMELLAICRALEWAPTTYTVTVWSDSEYAVQTFGRNAARWAQNGWVTRSGGAVKNQELIQRGLLALPRHSNVSFRWLKGHDGNQWNERADRLAGEARLSGVFDFDDPSFEQEEVTLF